MHRKSIGMAWVFSLAWLGSLAAQTDVLACGLFSCFRKNQTPVSAYYPPTTLPTAAPTAAATNGSCGPATCQQTVLKYVPQVAYRTVWQPVPVTTYRRTVSNNPTTGLPMTCTQPCTTYTYQARRVPYTTFRPVYTTEPVTAGATTAPVSAPAATVAPATVAPQCACNSTATGWSTGQPAYTAPGYTSPSVTAPGFTSPSTSVPAYTSPSELSPGYPSGNSTSTNPAIGAQATPWEPVDGSTSPATATPGYQPGTMGSGGADPANDRPRLSPMIDPNLNNGASSRSPSSSQGQSMAIDARSSTAAPGYTPPSTSETNTPHTTVRPEYGTPPGFPASGTTATETATGGWSSNAKPQAAPYTVRPLPKVESSSAPSQDSNYDYDPPPLLNESQDRTAIRPIRAQAPPARWASHRITWPERTVSVSYETEVATPAPVGRPSATTPRRLDPHRIQLKRFDSDTPADIPSSSPSNGWRSARRQ